MYKKYNFIIINICYNYSIEIYNKVAKTIPTIEQCQICAGITAKEFQKKCDEMEELGK